MKFYPSGFNNLLNKIENSNINSILLYGSDKGYINKIVDTIEKKFAMWRSIMTYQEFNEADLSMLLNSKNFFNKRELIKITNVTNALSPKVKKVLENEFIHFPVFIGEDLKAGTGIRKFFEDATSLASIACYENDQSINNIISSKCITHNKHIEESARIYLQTYLKGDSELISNELNKLIYFVGTKSNITITDVKNALSSELVGSIDELCIYFARKNLKQFLYHINKLLKLGTNEILIIRSISRYYSNLYITILKVGSGENIDLAIKSISPPIFFKYTNDFKNLVQILKLEQVVDILKILQQAEISFKLNSKSFDFYHNIYLKSYSFSTD